MKLLRKIQYNSPVVLTFAGVSLLALILAYVTGGVSNTLLFSVYRSSPLNPLFWLRLVLHVLGHGSYQHYLNNMLMILVIGPVLEEKYGSLPLLRAIGVTALVSGLMQVLFFPGSALLGASGIVFMMILLGSMGGVTRDGIPLTLILVAVFYIGGEIVALTASDNISQLSHIIGGVCGGVLGFALERRQ